MTVEIQTGGEIFEEIETCTGDNFDKLTAKKWASISDLQKEITKERRKWESDDNCDDVHDTAMTFLTWFSTLLGDKNG